MSSTAGLTYALGLVCAGERRMRDELLRVGTRHRLEHEIHHVTRDLARWSAEHVDALTQCAARHDVDLQAVDGRLAVVRSDEDEHDEGLVVLAALRGLYLQAAENSLAWEMLAQLAKAIRVDDVLDAVEACHPQNLRQLRWANTMIKTQTPQILTSLQSVH